ncbi:MAG: GTPase ObgE [candidate division Zixibacteria bacterium]|nr:GTPase ObgE [candidate division Zixibacteria bacterium]
MFIDYVEIEVQSGRGGDGCVSFRREKFIAKGGPDGGDGGRGGNVVFIADENMNTLFDFRYKRHYKAQRGMPGMGNLKSGKNGADIILKMPIGTIVKDKDTGEVLGDLNEHSLEVIVAPGGKGGKGNDHFKSATNQTPRHAIPGRSGVVLNISLELKLLADVGLVGYPNAGKSTLLSRVSAARPKIADYPFTTLVPNLGIVKLHDYNTLVMADIPGIIEGASDGKGLGFQFLRHIQRTAVLLFIIDGYECEIQETYDSLYHELEKYDAELVNRKIVKAVTKVDIIDPEKLVELKESFPDFKFISAVSGEGIDDLLNLLESGVKELDEEY